MNSLSRVSAYSSRQRIISLLHRRAIHQLYRHNEYKEQNFMLLPVMMMSSSASSGRCNNKRIQQQQPQAVQYQLRRDTLQKNMNYWRRLWESFLSSSSSITSSSPLSASFWWAKIPKGFENFYPKDGSSATNPRKGKDGATENKQAGKSQESGSSDNTHKAKDENKKDDKKNKQQMPPPNDPDQVPNNNVPGMIALLLFIMAARNLYESETVDGKEITFVEFRNYLLNSGQVERVEVINKQVARVVLRKGSPGITSTTPSSGGLLASDSQLSSAWNRNTNSSGSNSPNSPDSEAIEFNNNTNDGSIITESLSSSSNTINGRSGPPVYYFYIGSVESLEDKLTVAQQHMHPSRWVEVQYITKTNWALELIKNIPLFILMGSLFYFTRGMAGGAGLPKGGGGGGGGGMGNIFSIGKSNAKRVSKEDVSVTFADVAGCQQAKAEIMEFVDFLKDAERFTKLGARIPKGALLCGPPGTGKTLLAKAVAGEAGVPFFSISGSDFIEMFVGVGPSRVRDLFKEARSNSPCIVFIDEIDAVGRQRGRGGFSGGNDERENTLNQLLVEMDGFAASSGVVVLAGTNRVDILDQALTRPGRFDRQIQVDRPDLQGRKEIFNVHLKGITLEEGVEEIAGRLAGLTPGFTGADIANICNEAAIVAARREADFVTVNDFEKATDRIIGGLESHKIMSKEERSVVAHHEAGHAVAGWFLEHADPLLKVTIIPRTSGALGFAQYLPKEVSLRNKDQIMDIVVMALAGRAAEEVFFGRVTTGASDDLRRVTQIVYSMIKTYGMNSRVGQIAFPSNDGEGYPGEKPYSESTAEAMDEEARSIVDGAYERTLKLIREHKDKVEVVANNLLKNETITHDEIVDLIGPRPFVGDSQYQEYVSRAKPKTDGDGENKEDTSSNDSDVKLDKDEDGLTPGLA